jgi:hypothetical protein
MEGKLWVNAGWNGGQKRLMPYIPSFFTSSL